MSSFLQPRDAHCSARSGSLAGRDLAGSAHWKRGDKADAARFFQQGVDPASSQSVGSELRMFWAEAAELLGKPAPEAGTARNPR